MPDARVTAVLSLLSLLFTVGLALYDRRKQKKGLIRTTPTSRLPDGLHLLGSQNGESSVHNLWCVVLTLLSAGSDPIRPQDFVDGYLRFSFKDNAQIKDLTEEIANRVAFESVSAVMGRMDSSCSLFFLIPEMKSAYVHLYSTIKRRNSVNLSGGSMVCHRSGNKDLWERSFSPRWFRAPHSSQY